jgi:hypothetical protein
MVLQDLGNGHVSAVSYESRDPIDKTLKSFAINLTSNPGYGQILNQARGEKVEVSLQATNNAQPGTLTGTVIGVEPKEEAVSKDKIVHVEMLNMWCAEGMRSVKLPDVLRQASADRQHVKQKAQPRQVERQRQTFRRTQTQERQGLFRLKTLAQDERGCRTFRLRHSFEQGSSPAGRGRDL